MSIRTGINITFTVDSEYLPSHLRTTFPQFFSQFNPQNNLGTMFESIAKTNFPPIVNIERKATFAQYKDIIEAMRYLEPQEANEFYDKVTNILDKALNEIKALMTDIDIKTQEKVESDQPIEDII